MKYIRLGKTNLTVSQLCFGALTIGPLQANMSIEDGGQVIIETVNQGVNFIDTAELYETYEHIAYAQQKLQKDLIIASKTYAYTHEMAANSVEKARRGLKRDVIEIFMLHEQESEHTLKGHYEALEYLLNCKEKGIIKAVGVSMHHIKAVEAVCSIDEIDVIHPIVNYKGLGIVDGGIDQMLQALQQAYNKGIGIYAMKPLGGGNLISDVPRCLQYVLDIPYIHAIALGMQSAAEVHANVAFFNGEEVEEDLQKRLSQQTRSLHIDDWCEGCGECMNACKHEALYVNENTISVSKEKCVLCGYCGSRCPQFCIKVV